MLHMKAKSDTKSCGQFFRSAINVCTAIRLPLRERLLTAPMRIGSRYIYELYYDKEAMSKTLYDWLLKNGYADGNLIAKWKKQGYEKVCAVDMISIFGYIITMVYIQLCCLRCIQTKETNFNATCICRVPKAQLKEDQTIECVACGCRGCSSSD